MLDLSKAKSFIVQRFDETPPFKLFKKDKKVMSQKTNPLSLRLQKNNQNFSSPWFADFFFTENYHHEFVIDKYINLLLNQAKFSKAFFSVKKGYRKSNVFLVLQDQRSHQKEKQLSFNLRENKSFTKTSTSLYKILSLPSFQRTTPNTYKALANKVTLLNKQAKLYFALHRINKSYMTSFAELFFKESQKKNISFLTNLRKQIRNDFLKSKQYLHSIDVSYGTLFINKSESWYLSFFKGKALSNKTTSLNYLESDLQNQIENAWRTNNRNLIKKNGCLSFCERIVQQQLKDTKALQQKPDLLHFSELFPVITQFQPIRFTNDTQSVISLLDGVIFLLEKRISFRQIKSKLFQELSKNLQVKGVRISCSGRLGGRSKKAQKAKLQSDQWGETSLNAFSSKIVFASKSAYTSYGKVGIKIWLSFENGVC